MRIPSFPAGDSTLSGYEGWITLDSLEFTIDRDPEPSGGGGTQDINIGVGRINLIHLTKPTGVASSRLLGFAINGNSLGVAEIRVVDVGHGCVVPTAGWKLDRTFVASFSTKSVGDEVVDDFSFYFNKIAFAVAEDAGVAAYGWDKVTNTTWTTHGLDVALQNELNAVACLDEGDFTMDGVVDGADFLRWQRRASRTPADLVPWRQNFGQTNAAPVLAVVPEPAALALATWGMVFALGRRGGLMFVRNRRTREKREKNAS